MLNAEQNRNFERGQRLLVFLEKNTSVYNTYNPFKKEKESFTININLFKSYTPQKDIKGTGVTTSQKELKTKIWNGVMSICAMATSYAQEYNNPKLIAAMKCSKSNITKYKDADIYGMVLNIVNTLQPLMSDVHFMEYDITNDMLSELMNDATAYSNNLGTASVIDSDSSIANKNINDIIKLLDRNIKQFDRLINHFVSSHPDFVAGYRINAALENAPTRHTGIEGIVTDAATGQPIKDALVKIKDSKKETVTDGKGQFAIISMYGREYEVEASATGFEPKIIKMRVYQSKISELSIAL